MALIEYTKDGKIITACSETSNIKEIEKLGWKKKEDAEKKTVKKSPKQEQKQEVKKEVKKPTKKAD